ncbi:MAG: type IV toxin-antitoxin system AbiEi family antitoxin [Candidatus Latescibacterota bacterium]
MRRPEPALVEPYLARLRELPGIAGARLLQGKLHLRTRAGAHDLPCEVRQAVHRLEAQRLLEQKAPGLVLAPFVAPATARMMAEGGLQYLDLAGNCHLALGKGCLIHVEGKKPDPGCRRGRGLGTAGYQTLFALLARPELLTLPVRRFAQQAGIPKTVVGDVLQRLLADEVIGRKRRGERVLLQREALMARWLAGYENHLRPRLLFGRFRPAEDNPLELEKRLEGALGEAAWAWGGAAGAYRLTRYHRGEITVVHLPRPPADAPRRFRALPDPEGPLILLGFPGRLGLEGPAPHVAHPLLLYTELLHAGDDRTRETAAMIREKYLE